ncbi:hypothetical protein GOP47_0023255 [Adiantum capillus-veneris]|uniref:Glutaredoxin domain-containing protein n=1 Tax=Adiantum capillus-veneris TaxID=13818 RepID=A0A9D4U997_ADICA|nr:hypothetical protein GOP47_0023255 [Adiantum capillus-veneris]
MHCSSESHIISASRSSNAHQSCISSSSGVDGGGLHCRSAGHGCKLERLAGESAVVVFTLSSCCMCHVVCKLLCSLGVSPAIHEIDDDEGLQEALISLIPLCNNSSDIGVHGELHSYPSSSSSSSASSSTSPSSSPSVNVPTVFVGGKLLGGLDKVMSAHINGSLIPLLKDAGALWL